MILSCELKNYLLIKEMNKNGSAKIMVNGCSMLPSIMDGTEVIVFVRDKYELGDILAFINKSNNSITVHRLVMKCDKFYYCKGDNSFALEKITFESILGVVIFQNRDGQVTELIKPTKQFVQHSLKVGLEFCRIGFDKEKIKNSEIYIDFKERYLLN